VAKSVALIQVARPEDALIWVQLGYPGSSAPPIEALDKAVAAFNASPSNIDESRFIAWLDGKAIARASLSPLDNVIELRDFTIVEGYIAEYGTHILLNIAEAARPRGNLLTVDFYPPTYSRSFLGAGFKQNSRTRMMKSLATYTAQPINVPDGVTMRHPIHSDEPALAEMAYLNYTGTPDEEMVSGSRAQAAAIIHAMLHNDYNLLLPNGSYLAEDDSGNLVGDVIVGDASGDRSDPVAWIMDISVASAYRGTGLGKALLLSAINAAHMQGYPRIGLIVTIGNTTAQTFYRSLAACRRDQAGCGKSTRFARFGPVIAPISLQNRR
jgi:ribosomal protein S18 acetylase RimI-like enzyme